MYPIPPSEHLLEERKCRQCSTPFPITDTDMEFYGKVSPVFPSLPDKGGVTSETSDGGLVSFSENGYKTPPFSGLPPFSGEQRPYLIPPPTLCPDCRQQRRLAFRNERRLYKRKCDATGKDIVSIYSPDKPYRVYHQDYWWSDAWDPMKYGRGFDFERSAMEQFGELMREVPKQAINGFGNTNCSFTNYLGNCGDCYLTVAGVENKDTLYSYWMVSCRDCIDCSFCKKSSLLYQCVDCINCSDCFRCENCIDCSECFFSENLIGKSYYWKNKKYSPEEIEKLRKNHQQVQSGKNTKRKYAEIQNCENCFGDCLKNSLDCKSCFDLENGEHCSYGTFGFDMLRARDFDYDSGSEYVYETDTGYRNKVSSFLAYGNELVNSYCSSDCFSSSHLFLCTGLRNKSYCILNRQYTKEQYEELVPRIIEKMMADGEWGEFFPASLSPFGYNETVANEYYPLSREEVLGDSPLRKGDVTKGQGDFVSEKRVFVQNPPSPLSQGGIVQGIPNTFLHGPVFNWSDFEAPFPTVEKIIPANKLPDTIDGIPDDILNWAIECEVSQKPFRIIRQELEFYRKHSLPIPRRHPDVRHMDRMKLRNPRKLFERFCDCCGKKMITTHAPERPERVYCEACYEREV